MIKGDFEGEFSVRVNIYRQNNIKRLNNLRSHHSTFVVTSWLAGIVRLLNFPNHKLKGLRDIEIQESTGLCESTVHLLRQLTTFFKRNLSLFRLEITLVSNNYKWYLIRSLQV